MSNNKVSRSKKIQKWIIEILNKKGASDAFKAATLGNIERETAFKFFSNEVGEKSYGIMQHNLSNDNQRGRRFAQYMREKGFPNFKENFKNFNNLSEEKAKKLIQTNMEYAFIEPGESRRLNNVLNSEDVQEVASAYAKYERFRNWNDESSKYKIKHRALSQKHYDRISQRQSIPNQPSIQGTPENTVGIFQPKTLEANEDQVISSSPSELENQSMEKKKDLLNLFLPEKRMSEEVMTRETAPKSYDQLSFKDAFHKAYEEKGKGAIFTWKGKEYLLKKA